MKYYLNSRDGVSVGDLVSYKETPAFPEEKSIGTIGIVLSFDDDEGLGDLLIQWSDSNAGWHNTYELELL